MLTDAQKSWVTSVPTAKELTRQVNLLLKKNKIGWPQVKEIYFWWENRKKH